MSFFTATCAWCGQEYTAGVVGRTFVGTGHACTTDKPCDHDGCPERGIYAVSEVKTGPMGWLAGQGFDFACADHINDRAVFQCQARADDQARALGGGQGP